MTDTSDEPDRSTRTRLLDAAEHLFAREGLSGAPTRTILHEAGQRNESALQYHFGGRDGLVAALHDRRMAQLEVLRQPLLDALADTGPVTVRDVARIQLDTIVQLAREDPSFVDYLRLLGELVFTPKPELTGLISRFDLSANEVVATRLASSLGHLEPTTLFRRLDLARRFILMALSRWARAQGEFTSEEAQRYTTDLLDMVTAMLTTDETALS